MEDAIQKRIDPVSERYKELNFEDVSLLLVSLMLYLGYFPTQVLYCQFSHVRCCKQDGRRKTDADG